MSDAPAEARKAVRHRLLRLQATISRVLGMEMPLGVTIAIESELISIRQESLIEGRREGYAKGREVTKALGPRPLPPPIPEHARRPRQHTPLSHPPPPAHSTPVNPVDWVGPRRPLEDEP